MIKTRFERVVMNRGFLKYEPDIDIQRLIEDYALEGYRFCGMVPVGIVGYGIIKEMDFVFQKEE